MKLIFTAIAAAHIIAASAGADTVLDLTLTKAVRLALEKNFSIKVERFEPKIARERERSAKGRFDPDWDFAYQRGENTAREVFARDAATNRGAHFGINSISQDATWSTGVRGVTVWGLGYDVGLSTRSRAGTVNRFDEDFTSATTFSVTQPLLRGVGADANLAAVRIAGNNALASEWGLRERLMRVITDVIAVYNDLHFSKENHDVAVRSRELARRLLKDNIKRVEIGVMKEIDVTTAQAEVAAREEDVITASRAVKDQENFLKQLITADLLQILRTEVKIVPPPAPKYAGEVIGAIAQALEHRPDYRQAKLDLANRNIGLRFEEHQKLPRLDLRASLALNGYGDDFGTSARRVGSRDETDWTVGAVLSIPIGNNAALGRANAARLEVAQSLVDLQRLEQDIIVRVDNARGAILTARQRIEATRESRRLAKESLAAGEKRLIAGTGTVFEVLELQKKLAEAETAALRSQSDYNKAVAQFELETGRTLRAHGVSIE